MNGETAIEVIRDANGYVIGVKGNDYDHNGRLYYTGGHRYTTFHGEGKLFTDDGGYYQGPFNLGLKNGLFELYTERGIRRRTTRFVHDDEHGESIEYYDNGKIKSITHYQWGRKFGKCTEFADDGTVVAEYDYTNDGRVDIK